ncbi:bifunctional glycosyltransferase family 2/GtrA family protein [Microbacterium sp.]|uniref:bifunctional glycosyltransferase family 2/GtrA family protein n=1 Tax=Microbacterium sp. TaxID=51671 RepID=UPI00289E0A3D|nr:bifunctional glycosyltransferase family 2/GtrA family protein [Microbacterium sp.]
MHVVLIPAFEPDERLVALVGTLAPHVPVLVVDDGSGPAYARVFAAAESAGAEVIHQPRNRGKGAALRTGFARAARHWPGRGVVTADADGQHTPDDIARVAAALEAAPEGRTLVLGVREFTGAVPLRSRVGNAVTRATFRLATGLDVRDTQTGLRGFSADLLPWLTTISGDRFEYEFRMLLAARGAGIRLVQVPIRTVYLDGNASSHFRPIADSARIYAPLLRFSASAILAFLVDTGLLLILQALTGWLLISVVLARVVSAGMNFAINRSLVFGAGRSVPLRTAAVRYFSLAALLVAASFGMLTALTDAGMATLPAKLLTDGALFAVSFSVQRAIVFAPAPAPLPAAVARPRALYAHAGE